MVRTRTIELEISERDFILEFIALDLYKCILLGKPGLSDNTIDCLKNAQPGKTGLIEVKINEDEILRMLSTFRGVESMIKLADIQQNIEFHRKASAIVERLRIIEKKVLCEELIEAHLELPSKSNNLTGLSRSNIRIHSSDMGSWIMGN
jgi:hypothetical protein